MRAYRGGHARACPSERIRGSAVTELAICLLPYGLLVLGVILIGQLSLGKQEAFKSVAWTSPKPGEQNDEHVRGHFFAGPGEFSFKETVPYEPAIDDAKQEPVLPYTGENIIAGIDREAVRVTHTPVIGEDGQLTVRVDVANTQAGQALQDAGLIDTSGVIGSQTIDPDEVAGLSYDFTVNEVLAGEVAKTLDPWLSYSRSRSGYSFQLDTGGPLPTETPGEDADELRKEWRFGYDQESPGSEAEDDAFSLQTVSPDPTGWRGFHCAGDESAGVGPHLEDFAEIGYASEDGLVDPPQLEEPYIKPDAPVAAAWDAAARPPFLPPE